MRKLLLILGILTALTLSGCVAESGFENPPYATSEFTATEQTDTGSNITTEQNPDGTSSDTATASPETSEIPNDPDDGYTKRY